MAECGINGGLLASCSTFRRVGGLRNTAYITNLDDITGYTFDADGCVTAIQFDAYGGFYKYESRKDAYTGGSQLQVSGEGGNKFRQHDVVLKLYPEDCQGDDVINNLDVSNTVIVLEDRNQEFFIYGATNGLDVVTDVQNSGATAASDISDTVTFQGEEPVKPYRLDLGDYETTKAYIESLVI